MGLRKQPRRDSARVRYVQEDWRADCSLRSTEAALGLHSQACKAANGRNDLCSVHTGIAEQRTFHSWKSCGSLSTSSAISAPCRGGLLYMALMTCRHSSPVVSRPDSSIRAAKSYEEVRRFNPPRLCKTKRGLFGQ